MTTIERTTPRLLRNERRPNVDELATVLPPLVAERMAGRKELVEHERVAAHYAELRVRLAQLQLDLKAEQDATRAATAKAIRTGKPAKASTRVDELERELLQVGGELDTTAGLLPDTARAVLDASLGYVLDARRAANERHAAAVDAAVARLDEAVALLDSAGAIGAEANWIGGLIGRGEVAPFGATRSSIAVDGLRETRLARDRVAAGRERRLERAAQGEHARREVDSVRTPDGGSRRLPLPPGSTMWRAPGTDEPDPELEPAAPATADGE
jgi:hypothetical protein